MNDPETLSLVLFLVVIAYCLCQAVRDLRARQYLWAAAGLIAAGALASIPVKTHTLTINLPAP